jgi:hypothetical protein
MTDKNPLHGPYSTDQWGSYIFGKSDKDYSDIPLLDTRAWGYLTGKGHGALGLPIDKAHQYRKEFADRVVAALNQAEHDL